MKDKLPKLKCPKCNSKHFGIGTYAVGCVYCNCNTFLKCESCGNVIGLCDHDLQWYAIRLGKAKR